LAPATSIAATARSERRQSAGKLDLRPLLTHRFKLADINDAYKLFAERRDGVMKVVITP
jgi:threonine dehydrogenase-like Zn-dependent dehydrogenase